MINIQSISPSTKRPDRLAIRLVLQIKEAGCIHSLSGGRIEYQITGANSPAVYWYRGPFGHHTSYHDANADKPTGRIHQRLDPKGGGIFQTLPDGKVLGHEAHRWDAPAFSDIVGIQVFPPQGMVLVHKDTLLDSLKPSRSPNADHEVVLTMPEGATGLLGPSLLLVQAGAEDALNDWCKGQASSWATEGVVRLDVSVFGTFQPSLAIVVGSIAEQEQHG